MAFAFGLAASSFFPAIILGIFDKRMNMQGAISGMVIGIIFTASYIWYYKFGPGVGSTSYWMDISPEGIGTVGMFINLLISLIVSRLTPAPPKEIVNLVLNIRIPRGSGGAVGH